MDSGILNWDPIFKFKNLRFGIGTESFRIGISFCDTGSGLEFNVSGLRIEIKILGFGKGTESSTNYFVIGIPSGDLCL